MKAVWIAAFVVCVAPVWGQDVVDGTGRFVASFSADRTELIIRDTTTAQALHTRPLTDRSGILQRGTALIAAPERESFLVALSPVPELWEVALSEDAGPFHQGFVHSYVAGMEESLAAERGLFARQRIALSVPVVSLRLHADDRLSVYGTRADGSVVRIHLAVRREIETFQPGDIPHED